MTDSNEIIRRYDERAQAIQSLLCVGLDSDLARIPEPYHSNPQPRFTFNRWIIEQTHPFTSAYKLNMAFYEQDGQLGFRGTTSNSGIPKRTSSRNRGYSRCETRGYWQHQPSLCHSNF